MKTYGIIGTGAIGGYCAIKLMQAGFNVHCVLGSDYLFVKKNGLTLIENNQPITMQVSAYEDAGKLPACDVILIALKTTHNNILKTILPRVIHKDTIIVILQNGIGIENEISDFVSSEKIVGGSPRLKVTKTSPGVITHFGFNTIEFAQYDPEEKQSTISPEVKILQNDFKKANIDSIATSSLQQMRWEKLAGNIPVSGLSVILNASMQELVQHTASYQLLLKITREVISVAKQCGAHSSDNFYQFRVETLDTFNSMPVSYPSMKGDFDARRPLELHAIYENAITIAKQHHAAMPLTEMLYDQLLFLDAKNRN